MFDEDLNDEEDIQSADALDESAALVTCPHCGEVVEITLDASGGASQEYVEDCEVCCRPWQIYVAYGPDGSVDVRVEAG